MKICIFSDIHGNNYAFRSFVNEVKDKFDYYLFAGDIYGYYYGIEEILSLMKCLNPLKMVIGNHDANYIEIHNSYKDNPYGSLYGLSYNIRSDKLYKLLIKQSKHIELELDGIKIKMVHGTLNDYLNGRDYPDTEYDYYPDYLNYDVVIQGHTHYKMRKNYFGTMIINPGSIGQSRNGDGITYAVLDTHSKEVIFKKTNWNKESLYKEINSIEPANIKLIEVLEREIR